MRTMVLILFAMSASAVHAQSPFEVEVLSSKYDVATVMYDGSLASVADSEVTKLQPFKFLSIGNLKKMSAIANGTIYTIFTYNGNQFIIVESQPKDNVPLQSSNWALIVENNLSNLNSVLGAIPRKKNRNSYTILLGNSRVSIINIKTKEVKLFKRIVGTLEII